MSDTAQLSDTESRLLEAISKDAVLDLLTGEPEKDNVKNGSQWGGERTIRAEVLRQLAMAQNITVPSNVRRIRVRGARIIGGLDFSFSELILGMQLHNCFFDETMILQWATVPLLDLSGSWIPGVVAPHLNALADVLLRDGFIAYGEVNVSSSSINGNLVIVDGQLENSGDIALRADNIRIAGDFRLINSTIQGEVVLRAAEVRGGVICRSSKLVGTGSYGTALDANEILVRGNLFLDYGFRADGEVRVQSAQIQGLLTCRGGSFAFPEGIALALDRSQVAGGLYCDLGFRLVGELRLVGAAVSPILSFRGGKVLNPKALAIDGTQVRVDGPILMNEGFVGDGSVRLEGARAQAITCDDAHLTDMDLRDAEINKTLQITPVEPIQELELAGTHVGEYVDKPDSWPVRMNIDGFSYSSISSEPEVDAKGRLSWLQRQSTFALQPYEQLAKFYRDSGREGWSVKVSIAKHRQRHRRRGVASRLWGAALYATNGFGYRPWFSAIWLAALLMLGTFIFNNAHPQQLSRAKSQTETPPFQATIYTLDLLIPAIVNLGQRDAWIPHGVIQWWKLGFMVTGWVFAAILIGAVTEALRKRE